MTIICIIIGIMFVIGFICPIVLDIFSSNKFCGTRIHEFANRVADWAVRHF